VAGPAAGLDRAAGCGLRLPDRQPIAPQLLRQRRAQRTRPERRARRPNPTRISGLRSPVFRSKIRDRRSETETPLRVLVLFDSLEQQALAQSAWAAAHQAGIAVETVSLTEESQDEFAAQASVVHVIARPLRTSTGVRWQIQAGEAAYAQVKGPPRRRLVDLSELLSRFPDMRVAILQAPSDENRDRRSDASYDDAAMLRELAAELTLAGVGLVLTAPALPQEVILAAWKPLSKGLIAAQQAGGLFSTSALADAWPRALGEARQLAMVGFEGAIKIGFEAAWDLCLYAAAVE